MSRIETPCLFCLFLVAVTEKTCPSVIDDQVCRIALDAIPGTDLDTFLAGGSDQGEDEQENSILFVLRVGSEADVPEGERRTRGGLVQLPVQSSQGKLAHGRGRGASGLPSPGSWPREMLSKQGNESSMHTSARGPAPRPSWLEGDRSPAPGPATDETRDDQRHP
jgi:hypothetical protein